MLAAQSVPVSGIVVTLAMLVTSVALVVAWRGHRGGSRVAGWNAAGTGGWLSWLRRRRGLRAFGRSLQPVQSGHLAAFFTVSLSVPLIVARLIGTKIAAVPLYPLPGPVGRLTTWCAIAGCPA